MNKSTTFLLGALLLGALPAQSANWELGYNDGSCEVKNVYRTSGTEQGQAIRLSGSKLKSLKGQQITGLKGAFGTTRNVTGFKVFLKAELAGEALADADATVERAVSWQECPFDAPYTITGEETELYLGYVATVNVTSNFDMADLGYETPGTGFVLTSGEWQTMDGSGRGNPLINVMLSGDNAYTDIILRPIDVKGYFKAGESYDFAANLLNFSGQTVTSLDIEVSDGVSEAKKFQLTGLEIKPSESYVLPLEDFSAPGAGAVSFSINVTKVNGGSDADASDNLFNDQIYFYPQNMERSILFEGFTGQACGNCPSGHKTEAAVLEKWSGSPVVEVMHHAGYYPDNFTMMSDYQYTFFYGSSSTYAPAFMVNRLTVPVLNSVPVMMVSESNLNGALEAADATQPYASLKLETTYDETTRKLGVKLSGLNHTPLPESAVVLNVGLVQDGIVGTQSGAGSGYVHDRVFRGTLTGNSWGVQLKDEHKTAGKTWEWSTETEIPEKILSDYWTDEVLNGKDNSQYQIAAYPEDMTVVAWLAGYAAAEDVSGHAVYNCIETKLGSNSVQASFDTTGVAETLQDSVAIWADGGNIRVSGGLEGVSVHDLEGRLCGTEGLTAGVYLVKVERPGVKAVKKVLVK